MNDFQACNNDSTDDELENMFSTLYILRERQTNLEHFSNSCYVRFTKTVADDTRK